ncbi:MAG: hypothetical protein V3U13_03075 [Gemmatimonadota bacterium]
MSQLLRRVDARLPLALLQAVQQQDAPPDLLPHEQPGSFFPHRLGLSDVIEEQVRQFRRMARSRRRVEEDQVEALLELVSRRRDSAAIFAAAGRELAALHFSGAAGAFRRFARRLPGPLRRWAAVRALRAANGALLVASDLTVETAPLEIRATDTLTARVSGAGAACQLYVSLAACLLEMSGAGPVTVIHPECQGRGDPHCVWRALLDGAGQAQT